MRQTNLDFHIRAIESHEISNPSQISSLVQTINHVYSVSEEGFWKPGQVRMDETEFLEWCHKGEIYLAATKTEIIGVVRTLKLSPEKVWFGPLAVAAAYQGSGVGRRLVEHVEAMARANGAKETCFTLLVPQRPRVHEGKVALGRWYEKQGYRNFEYRPMLDAMAHKFEGQLEFIEMRKSL